MKIVTVHNYPGYFVKGGEGAVFEAESALLERMGHRVDKYEKTNSDGMQVGFYRKIKHFFTSSFSKKSYDEFRKFLVHLKPDIIHVHNFFYIISPSIFKAATDLSIPIVATLHNYRLISPCSNFIRNNALCLKCVNKNPFRIVIYKCYKKSLLASFFRYNFYFISQRRHRWVDLIDSFIVLSDDGRKRFITAGFDSNKIHVKPNFIDDPLVESPKHYSPYALYLGRLSPEKGVNILLEAWKDIDFPLMIAGDGPERPQLEASASQQVRFLGNLTRPEVFRLLQMASFVIVPSIWPEPFGLVNIEAMAMKKPIIASRTGSMTEIVQENVSGLLFNVGDSEDLKTQVLKLVNSRELCKHMGEQARRLYLEKYTPEKNYEQLISIYRTTLERYSKK